MQHLLKLNRISHQKVTYFYGIQIQHLLKLNYPLTIGSKDKKPNSNTTLVKVKYRCIWIILIVFYYSNTTLVKVKFRTFIDSGGHYTKFKYNTC